MGERIRAAGGVLWRPVAGGAPLTSDGPSAIEVCLVHRPRYDDWTLPKGKLEHGEHPLRAALREVEEETGLRAVVGRRLAAQEYALGEDRKHVDYWEMTPAGGEFTADDEVDALQWTVPEQAAELLSYPRDREFVLEFAAEPAPTAVLLLVRHAKAGSRSAWKGEDLERPLDRTGRAQAAGLRTALRWFAPTAVAAAEPVRCVDTVAPLAADLGVEVTVEPTLSEEAYVKDPAAGLDRVLGIAAAGGRSVLCSQGGVIPDLLGTLAGEHGVRLGTRAGRKIPSRKSSAWALSFVDGRLVAADYYAHLATAAP